MTRFYIIIFNFFLILLVSCSPKNSSELKGKITNAENKILYLQKFNLGNFQLIDSVKLKQKCEFRFKIFEAYPEFYMLKFNEKKYITLAIKPKDKILIETSYDDFINDYKVIGSTDCIAIKMLSNRFRNTKIKLDSFTNIYNKVKDQTELNHTKKEIEQAYITTLKNEKDFISNYIKNTHPPMAKYYAIYQQIYDENRGLSEEDLLHYRIVATALKTHYPNSPYTKAIISETKQMQQRISNNRVRELISAQGKEYPDIQLKNIKGHTLKLSDYKNNTILIAFWSYRDKNSLNQNEIYKRLYKRFKKKGLVIFHINVDYNTSMWEEIVKANAYPFENVHDTQSLAAMRIYNITKLPANYLIDINDKIVGKNLFGMYLEEKLNKLLK